MINYILEPEEIRLPKRINSMRDKIEEIKSGLDKVGKWERREAEAQIYRKEGSAFKRVSGAEAGINFILK
jgi:hypothetical protein